MLKRKKNPDSENDLIVLIGEVISGEIPLAKKRLVQAWIEIDRESLLADWELAASGQPLLPIDPLR